MSVASAVVTAFTKTVEAPLVKALVEKFELDETEVQEFWTEFTKEHLKVKGGKASGPKGKNGKGRISGYLLFTMDERPKVKKANPNASFTDMTKLLSGKWQKLSDKKKEEWNQKARDQNEANGIPTPTPKGKKTPAKASKKASAKSSTTMKLTRHPKAKAWVVQGTNFVVESPKSKVVVGKVSGTKVVALTAADVKKCKGNGWEVKAAKKASKPTKKKVEEPEEESDEEESDEDDDESDDEDSE